MDAEIFSEWLGGVKLLTRAQRSQAFMVLALDEAADDDREAIMAERPLVVTEPAATTALRADEEMARASDTKAPPIVAPDASALPVVVAAESRVDTFGCPHCGGRHVRRWGRASGLPRYRCGDCGRTFNGLTGTPLARLRKKNDWQDQAAALIAGESVAKAAERCGVAYTTAFRWRHRFLAAPAADKPNHLTGIVEADEMFVLESFKGKRGGLPRAARKRGGKAAKRGLSAEQIPVLVARDRTGATTDAVLPKLDKASVTAALRVRPRTL